MVRLPVVAVVRLPVVAVVRLPVDVVCFGCLLL